LKSENDNGKGRSISHRRFNAVCQLAIVIYIWLAIGLYGFSADAPGGPSRFGPDPQQYQRSVDRAIAFLQSHGQAEDGSFNSRAGVGITALVTTGVLRHGRGPGDPLAAKSLKYLGDYVQSDGGIYAKDGMLPNYETCMVIMCLIEANKDKRYNDLIGNAEAFIKRSQWGEATGKERSDLSYGGAGYGKDSRPDLSNTAYLIDALKACGKGADDPEIQNALVFVSRCQNFESADNTTAFAAKNPDGGFYYTCMAGGGSPAGKTDNGGLRSYGSMTYSGLKSMIYAGVKQDDPRVKAALEWIRKNYDVKNNPGLGQAGLYYYYNVFAKSLDALGGDLFEDAAGNKHDWRRELAEELFSRQKEDGSWINTNTKWMEGDPNLATGFALLALSYCRPKN
jgi:squalene-hopene/tetraprenyl-beta-curcumene cyclase